MERLDKGIFAIPTFLTPEECRELIQRGNDKGWNKSSVSGGGHGRTGKEDPRTSKFCMFIDPEFSTKLWDKIHRFIPDDASFLEENVYFNKSTNGTEWKKADVCERIRLYKYDVGDVFPEHIDYKMERTIVKDDMKKYKQHSFLTLLIYLNDDFTGGETGYWPDHEGIHCRFLRDMEKTIKRKDHQVTIVPETGKAVLQDQDILHEGLPPKKGTKYILRTDIMFEKLVNDTIHKKKTVGKWERLFETSCRNYAD